MGVVLWALHPDGVFFSFIITAWLFFSPLNNIVYQFPVMVHRDTETCIKVSSFISSSSSCHLIISFFIFFWSLEILVAGFNWAMTICATLVKDLWLQVDAMITSWICIWMSFIVLALTTQGIKSWPMLLFEDLTIVWEQRGMHRGCTRTMLCTDCVAKSKTRAINSEFMSFNARHCIKLF